jgi:4-amino-4-deoxy-L-arabinose transferase-like glycosyltransferase
MTMLDPPAVHDHDQADSRGAETPTATTDSATGAALDAAPPDPRWVRPAVAVLLALTGVLYMWSLGSLGWANDYYSAAVQAGSKSWKAFFFGSSDSANFITVDKPPASLWVMELSARVFGVNSWSILVPQALEGVAAVGLLYLTVKRWFGAAAGLVAGAVMATTPVAALMFRYNNPDALMVLLMVAAAYAVTRAIESGATKWLVWAGVFLGFAFLAKMLQAFTVLPTFALAYLIAGPPKLARRLWQLTLAGAALVASIAWWVAVVELWPADSRPYIGGSTDNSVLDLVFGYNGFGRLTGNETGAVVGGGPRPGAWGPTGWTRMFNEAWGGQASWLIPAALAFAVLGLVLAGRTARTDRLRAAMIVWGGWLFVTAATFSLGEGIIHEYYAIALAPGIGALVGIGGTMLWTLRGLWWARAFGAAVTAVTAWWAYTLLDRTPDWQPWVQWAVLVAAAAAVVAMLAGRHTMGVALAAAAVAALLGPLAFSLETVARADEVAGAIPLAGPSGQSRPGPGGRPAGVARPDGQAGQQGSGQLPRPGGQLPGGQIPGGQIPGGQIPGGQIPGGQIPGGQGPGGQGTGGQIPGGQIPGGQVPSGQANPGNQGGGGSLLDAGTPSDEVVQFLEDGKDGFTWALATIGANRAAGYQLATDDPVMAIGGFNGTDQWPTLEKFQQMVADGLVHYFLPGGGPGVGGTPRQGGSTQPGATGQGTTIGAGAATGTAPAGNDPNTSGQITTWVTENFATVTVGGTTFYDLTQPLP